MLEGAERRASMCQDFYQTFYLRERYIVSVNSNILTQISCGIKTKCRKTRAMQRDFTIVDSLALRQCNTSMIPDTHQLKLLFPTRYTSRSIYQSSMCDSQSASSCGLASSIYIAAIYYYDAFLRFPYKIQTSSYSGRIFAQIKRAKNIDSFEKKQYHYC